MVKPLKRYPGDRQQDTGDKFCGSNQYLIYPNISRRYEIRTYKSLVTNLQVTYVTPISKKNIVLPTASGSAKTSAGSGCGGGTHNRSNSLIFVMFVDDFRSWAVLVALDRSWSLLSRSWSLLGRSWSLLGGLGSVLGPLLGGLGSLLGGLGSLLGRLGAVFGRSWVVLGWCLGGLGGLFCSTCSLQSAMGLLYAALSVLSCSGSGCGGDLESIKIVYFPNVFEWFSVLSRLGRS